MLPAQRVVDLRGYFYQRTEARVCHLGETSLDTVTSSSQVVPTEAQDVSCVRVQAAGVPTKAPELSHSCGSVGSSWPPLESRITVCAGLNGCFFESQTLRQCQLPGHWSPEWKSITMLSSPSLSSPPSPTPSSLCNPYSFPTSILISNHEQRPFVLFMLLLFEWSNIELKQNKLIE